MTIAEILPWANLLLVPSLAMLSKISNQLTRLEAIQGEHERRIGRLEYPDRAHA